MRVGVVSSSKNLALGLKRNLMLIIAISLLYAMNVFAIGEIKLLPTTEGGGELRPFIFIPALASIIFGPLVGSFSAGFGNILIDILQDVIIEHDTLDLGNLAGFIGNFVGAGVVGLLAWRLKFDKDDRIIFSGKHWLRYIQNTIAGTLGLGLVCGEIIGLLRIAFNVSTWSIGNLISTSIFYHNSLFLLFSLIPLQIIVGFYEKIRSKRYANAIHDSQNVKLLEEPENPPAIIEAFEINPGVKLDGLVKGEWSQIKMIVRNNTPLPMAFRLEINCEDRIDPSVAYTPVLNPGDQDEKFFQINPFNDSTRIFTVYIKSWAKTYNELTYVAQIGSSVRYRYTYDALTPFEHHFNSFTNFLAICSFAVLALNSVRTIYGNFDLTNLENARYFIWSMVVIAIEIVFVFAWYTFRLVTVQRRIARAERKAKQQQWEAKMEEEKKLREYDSRLDELSGRFGLSVAPTPAEEGPSVSSLASARESTISEIPADRATGDATVDSSELALPPIPSIPDEEAQETEFAVLEPDPIIFDESLESLEQIIDPEADENVEEAEGNSDEEVNDY
ncbi:MAG: hypothetical protein GF308_14580 [Candidatus Heimdallarchaeota archaeon]|nr:hypothetical protein [Candidatus Heimdallarchaeota archaeon]